MSRPGRPASRLLCPLLECELKPGLGEAESTLPGEYSPVGLGQGGAGKSKAKGNFPTSAQTFVFPSTDTRRGGHIQGVTQTVEGSETVTGHPEGRTPRPAERRGSPRSACAGFCVATPVCTAADVTLPALVSHAALVAFGGYQ